MVELFHNPNITTALVERLPCAFAPSVNGKLGTHYAMVLLDKNGNVAYVGSECEHTNGEGIQAIHEMGDKDSTLCYVVTAAFRKALMTLHNHPDDLLSENSDRPKDAMILSGYMNTIFDKVWLDAINKHNRHLSARRFRIFDRQNERTAVMQRTVNTVTASLLKINPMPVEPTNFSVVSKLEYPPVFEIWGAGDGFSMSFYSTRSKSFAERVNGSWTIAEDRIKSWAKDDHTPFENAGKYKTLYSNRRCFFCNEEYSRMSKHTRGSRHIDRVLEVAKITCKATSRTGLQMLNNPRTRSVFIKR